MVQSHTPFIIDLTLRFDGNAVELTFAQNVGFGDAAVAYGLALE
jgi:hypothetical protein